MLAGAWLAGIMGKATGFAGRADVPQKGCPAGNQFDMASVTLASATRAEKDLFATRFQDYLHELSKMNGARSNRNGLYEYSLLPLYWQDQSFMPFFVEMDGRRAGLLLVRELPAHESHDGRPSLQVAEIYVFAADRRRGVGKAVMRLVAGMASERGLPLTWSAYMSNRPANALYLSILDEYGHKAPAWLTQRTRGVDRSGLARFYYTMAPPGAER